MTKIGNRVIVATAAQPPVEKKNKEIYLYLNYTWARIILGYKMREKRQRKRRSKLLYINYRLKWVFCASVANE